MSSWLQYLKEARVVPYQGDGVRRTHVVEGPSGSLFSVNEQGRKIPSVSLGEGANVVGIANAVLGLANLGIGIYTAYQARSSRTDAAAAHSEILNGLGNVEALLQEQCTIFAAIVSSQDRQHGKLDEIILRQDRGFAEVLSTLDQHKLDRHREAFLDRVVKLQSAKRDLLDGLQPGCPPHERDLQRLQERAEDLATWAWSRLIDKALPVEARQPLVFAHVDAVVAREDAQLFAYGSAHESRAIKRMKGLRQVIREEVAQLHDGATPWRIASFGRERVARYAMLNRCLALKEESIAKGGEALEIREWDDGLPVLEFEDNSSAEPIALRTIADYEWLIEAFDLDRGDFDVHARSSVSRAELGARLGFDGGGMSSSSLRALVLAGSWSTYQQRVQSEFDVKIDIRLVQHVLAPVAPPPPEAARPLELVGVAGRFLAIARPLLDAGRFLVFEKSDSMEIRRDAAGWTALLSDTPPIAMVPKVGINGEFSLVSVGAPVVLQVTLTAIGEATVLLDGERGAGLVFVPVADGGSLAVGRQRDKNQR
jgi:hypothetical protein